MQVLSQPQFHPYSLPVTKAVKKAAQCHNMTKWTSNKYITIIIKKFKQVSYLLSYSFYIWTSFTATPPLPNQNMLVAVYYDLLTCKIQFFTFPKRIPRKWEKRETSFRKIKKTPHVCFKWFPTALWEMDLEKRSVCGTSSKKICRLPIFPFNRGTLLSVIHLHGIYLFSQN